MLIQHVTFCLELRSSFWPSCFQQTVFKTSLNLVRVDRSGRYPRRSWSFRVSAWISWGFVANYVSGVTETENWSTCGLIFFGLINCSFEERTKKGFQTIDPAIKMRIVGFSRSSEVAIIDFHLCPARDLLSENY